MFRIGEFSKIAQVSGRLLRYYDEIDLFKPAYTELGTGYRYYQSDQLTRLNRILALRDLGLSLEQIQTLIKEGLSEGAIRDILTQKKKEIQQKLAEDFQQLQQIETRLAHLGQEEMWSNDIVLKEVPSQPYLSYREPESSLKEAEKFFFEIYPTLLSQPQKYKFCISLLHSPTFDEDEMDWELGFLLSRPPSEKLTQIGGKSFTLKKLPEVKKMATLVHRGLEDGFVGFNKLGRWIEANHFEIVGPTREIYLELVKEQPQKALFEIQIPIKSKNFL